MFDSYFAIYLQVILAVSFLFIAISIVHFEIYDNNKSLFLLLTGALGIKLFMILLTPYLMLWDESFHGLVAKHLADNPLKPLLYKDPFFEHDYKNWWDSSIWLHKQPWFLWQIALSIKIFGNSYFAVRFPSLVYAVAGVFLFMALEKILPTQELDFMLHCFIV